MEDAGPLKICGFVAIHEASIAQEHGAQHSGDFRAICEQRIDLVPQTAARPRDCSAHGWSPCGNARHKFRSTKCGDEVDILRCQVRAPVECPFVSEYLRLLGLRYNRDFISGVEVQQD
jgi:hypothetical protein